MRPAAGQTSVIVAAGGSLPSGTAVAGAQMGPTTSAALPTSSSSKGNSNPLRASRGARPQEVYHAAVQHLEKTLSSAATQHEDNASHQKTVATEKPYKRASVECFRPGALSALAESPAQRLSAHLTHDNASSSKQSDASAGQSREGTASTGSTAAPTAAEALNRGLSLPVTNENPLGQDCSPQPVSPVAVHGPPVVSRNLSIRTSQPAQAAAPSASHGQSR